MTIGQAPINRPNVEWIELQEDEEEEVEGEEGEEKLWKNSVCL
jgi:hypothetical protein